MPVYRTVFQVEVLSEEEGISSLSLSQIAEEILDGGSSGSTSVLSTRELSNVEARVATLAQGSDPSFFSALREEDDDDASVAAAAASDGFELPVYFPVSATDEHGSSPMYAKLVVKQAFLETLARLEAVCSLHGLNEARVDDAPDSWGPNTEELRLQLPELVVSSGSFWFRDHPKHTNYEIETPPHPVDALSKLFGDRALAGDSTPAYLGPSPDDLQQCVEDADGETDAPSDAQR